MLARNSAPRVAAGLLAAGAIALAGCGGSDDDATAGRAAPDPAGFPAPDGRTLEQVLSEAPSEGPVISPTGQVFRKGKNRYAFGVFTPAREQISDAEVAIYAAHGRKGEALGPYPARVESLKTAPAFESKSTSDDPDAARTVYVTEVEFDRDGEWRIGALTRSGDSLGSSVVPSVVVRRSVGVPQPGEVAPRVHTPTVEEVGGDIEQIETRDPPDTQHEQDLADVLGEKPVVLSFATPLLCQSRVCGPVVDVAEEVKAEHGDDVAFIHMEIFKDNDFDKGVREQVKAYGLPTEPWLFVIDEDGRVRTALEGAYSADELRQALEPVSG